MENALQQAQGERTSESARGEPASGFRSFSFSSTHTKFPRRKSRSACSISSLVFMTNGPYRAIGSLSGLPDTHRKREELSDVTTLIESPSPSTTNFVDVKQSSAFDPQAGKHAAPSKRERNPWCSG